MLAQLLSNGKKAPFYKILVEEKKLTSNVRMFNQTSELSGKFRLAVRAFAGTDLNQAKVAIDEAFQKFESEGISKRDLNRIKAGQETSFYNSLSNRQG